MQVAVDSIREIFEIEPDAAVTLYNDGKHIISSEDFTTLLPLISEIEVAWDDVELFREVPGPAYDYELIGLEPFNDAPSVALRVPMPFGVEDVIIQCAMDVPLLKVFIQLLDTRGLLDLRGLLMEDYWFHFCRD